MEVHHHTSSTAKRFKHYLFEFVMLFLAVFAGFLAENAREHMADHKKEKQYIQSMISDLQHDTSMLKGSLEYYNYAVKSLDTLLDILEQPSLDDSSTARLYWLNNFAVISVPANFAQGTLSQLKNAGGLRLIRDKLVSDSISVYDHHIVFIQDILKTIDGQTTTNMNFATSIFDNRYWRKGRLENRMPGSPVPKLLTTSPSLMRQYANYASIVHDADEYFIELLDKQQKLAGRLIQLMRKEYHL